MSATSNVINRSGHYDEVPGRRVAECLAASLNAYLTGILVLQGEEEVNKESIYVQNSIAESILDSSDRRHQMRNTRRRSVGDPQ